MLGERAAFEELHDQHRRAAPEFQTVEQRKIAVTHRRHRSRLASQSGCENGIHVRKGLDGTWLLKPQVQGTVHDPHAPSAHPLKELQTVAERVRSCRPLQQSSADTGAGIRREDEPALEAFARGRIDAPPFFEARVAR